MLAFLVCCIVKYMNRRQFSKVLWCSILRLHLSLSTELGNGIQLLGLHPNSKYYKMVLDNSLVVEVKRLGSLEGNGTQETTSSGRSKSVKRMLLKELKGFAGVRPCNLNSLRAYVRKSDEFVLVFDYMLNGSSLEDVMTKIRAKEIKL
ncbi:hypothetical protein Bca101_020173 [Brassica carinata]